MLVLRLLVLAAVLALLPTALAGSSRSVVAPAPVSALSFDGPRSVYATGRSATDCNRVFTWNVATRTVTRFGRGTHCEQTSTGNAIASVSIAGDRVLWLHYAGGNSREWSLWTATKSRPLPIRIRRVTTDADAPAPIVLGDGRLAPPGDLLSYAVGSSVVALRAEGSRRFTWAAPARVVALSTGDGELAVATEGGTVTVLDAAGSIVRTETFGRTVEAVRLTGDGLVAQSGRSLEVRRARQVQTFSLIGGVRLADAEGRRAILVGGGLVRVLELDSGRGRVVAAGTAAQLEDGQLVTASGRRLTLRPLP